MAKGKQTRTGRFALGMLIYALIVVVLLLAGLRPLWSYLVAYEDSGPEKAMDRYLESLDEAKLRELAEPFLAGLDLRWQTPEEAFAALNKQLGGDLRYALKSAGTDLRSNTYNIRSGRWLIGTVSIAKGEDPRFGFAPWELTEESYDFSALLHDEEITVPDTWTVRCAGTALGESERVGEPEEFALLRELYGDGRFTLPHLVTYRVSGVVGEAPLSLTDAQGQARTYDAERSEEELLANCGADAQAEIQTLLDGFLQRYIDCLSNASRNVQGNYNALKPYIVADSAIDKIIRDNMAGQQWAHSHGDTVTARDDLLLMELGGGYYLAELDYTLDTVGNKGHVESVNRVLVIMQRTDAGLRVIELYSL